MADNLARRPPRRRNGRSVTWLTVIEADVVVVGGGPAGSAAAIVLARSGRDVLLVDKARFPRDKCCGDGLTTGALRWLDLLGLDPATMPSWQVVDAAWVRSPSGRVVELPFPQGRGQFGAVVRRQELDAALVDLARAAGARVHDGHAVVGATEHDDRVVLGVDGLGAVHARYAIGADGMWSTLRKLLGQAEPGYLGEWHAFRQYATGVTGSAAERLWVWFEPDLLPGYAWSFPLPGGEVNVGFGVLRTDGRRVADMKRTWPELLARPHVVEALGPDATFTGNHKAWPIPARIDRAVLGTRRALFVGDAAGATDPMTGEGIAQALESGILAAEAVMSGGALEPEAAQRQYRLAVRGGLVPDHRMSMALQRVLQREWGARAAVRIAGLSPWTRRNFARWLFEDEPRAVLATPSRWHRHFLARPGVFS
jgi:geranylgeranyl reductase family protein